MSVIKKRLEARGTTLCKNGRGESGPCPKCGGDDRFNLWFDEKRGREVFWCRRCQIQGDDIQYLRDVEGMSYFHASEIAQRERSVPSDHVAAKVEDAEAWLHAGRDFIHRCNRALLKSKEALQELYKTRGIVRKTAERFLLGINKRQQWVSRQEFGLPAKVQPDGREVDLCLPAGLVIPITINDGELRGIQIRRFESYNGNRYSLVPGSALEPMVFPGPSNDRVFVVESYLDGSLLWQELGGGYTVIALGSVSVFPKGDLEQMLRSTQLILVSLDTDAAGAAQAQKRWLTTYPQAVRFPIPSRYGKDPCEARNNGLSLAAWGGIGMHCAEANALAPVPVAPGEVQGGGRSATLRIIGDADEAATAVAEIVADDRPIGVALVVGRHPAHEGHPHAGYHPRLSRVQLVAVYAEKRREVVVFELPKVGRKPLLPLWKLTVVTHDGVELMRHFPRLRQPAARVECTLLQANALTNQRLPFDKALRRFLMVPPIAGSEGTPEWVGAIAVALASLYSALCAALNAADAWILYKTLRQAQGAVAAMEVLGVAFDSEAHEALRNRWIAERAEWRAKLPASLNVDKIGDVRDWIIKVVPANRRRG